MKAQPLAVLVAFVALASACGKPPLATPVPLQRYFQFSSAFLVALTDLVAKMGMPRGEPYGSYCHGLDTDLIDLLFP